MSKEQFRRTKILATIGPATDSAEMLDRLIGAGLDNCRLNFSHGTYEKWMSLSPIFVKLPDKYGRQCRDRPGSSGSKNPPSAT